MRIDAAVVAVLWNVGWWCNASQQVRHYPCGYCRRESPFQHGLQTARRPRPLVINHGRQCRVLQKQLPTLMTHDT